MASSVAWGPTPFSSSGFLLSSDVVSAPDEWEPDAFTPFGEDGDGLFIPLDHVGKNEWLHHLNAQLRELGRRLSAATKMSADGFSYEERWFNDQSKDLVRLMIFNGTTGLFVLIGTCDGGDSDAETAYQTVVSHATESTGKRREPVAWEATVCQVLEPRGLHSRDLRIGAARSRNLTLDTWGSMHSEDVPTWFPGMGIRGGHRAFWPIRVTGTVSCYSWDKDGAETTAPQLRYLVELLTLAFDCPMEVRVGPYEASIRVVGEDDLVVPGLRAPTVPEDHPWRSGIEAPTKVPEWLTEALDGRVDTTTRRALSAHHEGMLLKSDHPSMALLAFVSAIEALAVPRKGLPRCSECRMVLDSGKRFREALATVLSPADVESIANAYDRRSRTVHDGCLHGLEEVLGMYPIPQLFAPELSRVDFELGTVRLAAQASRKLLLTRFGAPANSSPSPKSEDHRSQ